MIKCNVTLNGTVSRAATVRTDKDGRPYIGFAVKMTVPGKTGNKEVEIFVSKDGTGTETSLFPVNARIAVQGTLTFKKRGDALYMNMQACSVDFHPQGGADSVEGTLEFRGTVGKQVEERTDKKGNKYLTFSGFSAEKTSDGFAFIWVRFIRFSAEREAFLSPKGKIQAKGKLELSAFMERIGISCRLEEISEWVKQPYNYSNPT